jgi:Uma2 family endonuclease
MATIVQSTDASITPLPLDEHVLLRGISWNTYQAILDEIEGNRRLYLTYDEGDLEIMSPSPRHESAKRLIGRMVEAYTEELGIPIRSLGSTTFTRQVMKKGLEPDECYYLEHELLIRGKEDLNLDEDPPPDLAIEVDVTRRVLKRFPIYSALGFPEIWQYIRGVIKVHTLDQNGVYVVGDTSKCLPQLPVVKLPDFIRTGNDTDETTWIRGFRAWVRTLG